MPAKRLAKGHAMQTTVDLPISIRAWWARRRARRTAVGFFAPE